MSPVKHIIIIAIIALSTPALGQTTTWYEIRNEGGDKIGQVEKTFSQTDTEQTLTQSSLIRFNEMGAAPKTITTESHYKASPDGRLESARQSVSIGGQVSTLSMDIDEGLGTITRTTGRGISVQTFTASEDARWDFGNGLLPHWDRKTPLEFENIGLQAEGVERIVIEPAPSSTPSTPKRFALQRRSYSGVNLRTISRIEIDAAGQILSTTQPLLGTELRILKTTQAQAESRNTSHSAVQTQRIKSPYRLPVSALRGHIRYTFGFKGDLRFDLPLSAEQRTTLDDDVLVVDICADCGVRENLSKEELRAFTQPTLWMEIDHKRITRIVSDLENKEMSNHRKMEILSARARRRLEEVDFTGHFSAVEALVNRRGDCGEDAVVLAALGRAAGIPTRVVGGLVYSRARYHGVSNVFMPHSWTQAYIDGAWRSYDISLDGFDTSHIMLTVGEGDPRTFFSAAQLSSYLEWQEMAAVESLPEE